MIDITVGRDWEARLFIMVLLTFIFIDKKHIFWIYFKNHEVIKQY